jgi:hypothetical protein
LKVASKKNTSVYVRKKPNEEYKRANQDISKGTRQDAFSDHISAVQRKADHELLKSTQSMIANLTIVGGDITASCTGSPASGSGFGTGDGGTLTRLSLWGCLTVRTTGVRAQSLLLSNGSLVFVIQASALFVESVSLSMSESVDLAIFYGQPMTEDKTLFSGLSNPFLHCERMRGAPEGGGLRWCVLSSGYERCFFDEFFTWAVWQCPFVVRIRIRSLVRAMV